MSKGSKIFVFAIVAIIVLMLGQYIKMQGGGAVMSIFVFGLFGLYYVMFPKKKKVEENSDDIIKKEDNHPKDWKNR